MTKKKLAFLAITTLLSFIVLCLLFGTYTGIAINFLLVFHEVGHYLVARKLGAKPTGIYMIPLLGAATTMEREIKKMKDEAIIAIAGPIFGVISSAIILFIATFTGSTYLFGLAGVNAFINLFQILPLPLLDGGRVTNMIILDTRKYTEYCLVGLQMLVGSTCFMFYGYIVPLLLGAWSIHNIREEVAKIEAGQKIVGTKKQRIVLALAYVTTTIVLALMTLLFFTSLEAMRL